MSPETRQSLEQLAIAITDLAEQAKNHAVNIDMLAEIMQTLGTRVERLERSNSETRN